MWKGKQWIFEYTYIYIYSWDFFLSNTLVIAPGPPELRLKHGLRSACGGKIFLPDQWFGESGRGFHGVYYEAFGTRSSDERSRVREGRWQFIGQGKGRGKGLQAALRTAGGENHTVLSVLRLPHRATSNSVLRVLHTQRADVICCKNKREEQKRTHLSCQNT